MPIELRVKNASNSHLRFATYFEFEIVVQYHSMRVTMRVTLYYSYIMLKYGEQGES